MQHIVVFFKEKRGVIILRIKEARKLRSISGPALAEKIGITSQYLYDIENGKARARIDLLEKIANVLNVSLDYLAGRSESPLPIIVHDDKEGTIPILGYIRAGLPLLVTENIQGYIKPPEGVKADFALFVKGESMIPVYHPGVLVYIRQQPTVENGEVAVVLVGNEEATLKKVKLTDKKIELIPFNQAEYDTLEYKPEEVSIIGKVVHPFPPKK